MARITERQQQEIKEIILDSYYLGEIDDIEDKSNLFDDLGFDDLDFVEFSFPERVQLVFRHKDYFAIFLFLFGHQLHN